LVPLLRRDGQYCEQCSDPCSESKSCTEQSVQFNLIFTVSQAVFTCGTVVAGLMLDKCGPRITCTAGLLAVASGCAIVAVSESDSLNLFLPGFICLSLGAPAIHLSWFHISNLYPEKKASVSSFVVACFVASGLCFFIFNVLYSAAGISKQALFLFHAGIVTLLAIASFLIWPDGPFQLGDVPVFEGWFPPTYTVHSAATVCTPPAQSTVPASGAAQSTVPASGGARSTVPASGGAKTGADASHDETPGEGVSLTGNALAKENAAPDGGVSLDNDAAVKKDAAPGGGVSLDNDIAVKKDAAPGGGVSLDNDAAVKKDAAPGGGVSLDNDIAVKEDAAPDGGVSLDEDVAVKEDAAPVAPSVIEQMQSPSFIGIGLFFSLHYLRFTWYVGSAADQLGQMGDDDSVYTNILSLALPLSALATPAVGYILDSNNGFIKYGWAVTLLSVLYGLIFTINNLPLQIAGFVFFGLFRITLFSGMFTFVAVTFGFRSFGRLSGTILACAGILSTVSILLVDIVEYHLDGEYFWINICMLVIALPLLTFPIYLWRRKE